MLIGIVSDRRLGTAADEAKDSERDDSETIGHPGAASYAMLSVSR